MGKATTTTTLSKSAQTAARILSTLSSQIPAEILRDAHGLAIYSVLRGGMWLGGAAGSGVLIARLPPLPTPPQPSPDDHGDHGNVSGGGTGTAPGSGDDSSSSRGKTGKWSGPAAFSVGSGSAGLVLGVDYVECVAVLNTAEAVRAYCGGEEGGSSGGRVVAVEAGVGGGFGLGLGGKGKGKGKGEGIGKEEGEGEGGPDRQQTNKHKEKKAVSLYTKSKGLYGGVTVEGTVVKARQEVNDDFYGEEGITVQRILSGQVKVRDGQGVWPAGADELMKVLDHVVAGA